MRKVAFITGASGGIGSACARQLAKDGYAVALGFSSNESAANALSAELKSQGFEALAVQCDITDSGSIASAVSLIEKDLGAVSLLVNNAGIANISLFTDNSYDDLKRMLDTDLLGAMELSRQVLPAMISAKCGNIINISSVWGEKGASCEVAYCAAKAGLIGFTKALGKELGPSGVRVNCVSPGFIDTKMNAAISPEDRKAFLEDVPLQRAGKADEVADVVAFLVSDAASYITAQNISVNGGLT